MDMAADVFSEHGYDGASMAQLAKACGVSKALIYHYYDSKDALLFDILEHHLSTLLDVVLQSQNSKQAPEENLLLLVTTILDTYRGADAKHRLQLQSLASLPDEQQKILSDIQRQIVATMSDAVFALEPAFFDARPEELRPTTMSAFGMLNWFYLWYQKGKGLDREGYAALVTDMIIGGVERRANSV